MLQDVKAPDLGTESAEVIEIPVKPGDTIRKEQTIAVLESAKASMEVPSPVDGVVKEVVIAVGSQVSEGALLLRVDVAGAAAPVFLPVNEPTPEPVPVAVPAVSLPEQASVPVGGLQEVKAPDLGTDHADVIEILVKPGDVVRPEQAILVLESAKATMEVPSPLEGVVREVCVRLGDKVSEGMVLLRVEAAGAPVAPVLAPVPAMVPQVAPVAAQTPEPVRVAPPVAGALLHCGPAVRRLARELGVDLARVTGTGPKGRILKEDVHGWVKSALSRPVVSEPAAAPGNGLPPLPVIDFSKWGPVEIQPLTRIQALSAKNLHRAWVHIPHVTQFDEADITELEAFRVARKDVLKGQGINLTLLAFLVKAVAHLLQRFPRFNASLAGDGESLVLKQYVHIGVAVDTPNGLVVPVIRDCDRKSVGDIARDLGELSVKARDKKLSPAEMQGACFSISSLGGIGGTAFTPIVNWPEVAILGVSRSSRKPVWDGEAFQPRLMLPLSLSYDHRVIDGADAARFTTALADVLKDIRQILL